MNLSGIIFHIEEDAYEKLNKYLSTIRGYFSTTEGRDEIMGDIESRIAEMLQEKVSQAKQAVLLADVESIIAVMGKPEDFASEKETNTDSTQKEKEESAYSGRRHGKRLFRDPDDRLVGGVCSGIANYFDIDPIWIRAAFAIALFVFGTGVLLYVILWMIIPLAVTAAEKLQMRGEKVDINNIGKVVHEEITHLKTRVNKFGEEVSSPETRERFRNTTRSAGQAIGSTITAIFKAVGKVFSVIFLIISIILLTGLLAGIFGKGNFMIFDADSSVQFSLYEIAASILPSGVSSEMVVATLLLFLGIPLLFIIYNCVRVLFNIRQRNRIINLTAAVLWLIGIALVVYIGVCIGNDFSTEAYTKRRIEITQPANKKLYLDMNVADEDKADHYIRYTHRGSKIRLDNWNIISKEGNHYRLGYPRLDIVPSETDSFQLVLVKTAHGEDKAQANELAKNISYEVLQKDSTLLFNNYFDIAESDKFRAQEVKIILKVPVNRSIYLSKRMERIIFDIENVTNTLDRDMVNRTWIMTRQGLECVDCTGLEATVDDAKHESIEVIEVPEVPEAPEAPEAPERLEKGSHKRILIRKGAHGEIKTEDIHGPVHKEIIIKKDENGNVETEDVKGEPEKKIIIRKKIKEEDEKAKESETEPEKNKSAVKKFNLFQLIPV
jgi:phage shock protein PspC (stress-responsive transcriptional regulator)